MTTDRTFGPVRFIAGENSGKYPHSNSLYIEGAGILVDAGASRRKYQALLDGPGVAEVWLSHWHEDHIGCLDLFDDLPLRQMEIEAEPLAGLESFLDWYGFEDKSFRQHWRTTVGKQFNYRPRRASSYFKPGEIINLAACQVEVIHTPGHTPGSISLFFPEPAVLFMADYDLTSFGPWYGDRDSSIELTVASVERLRQVPAQTWLTSHEQGIFEEPPGDLFDRYLGVIAERESKLIEYLRLGSRTMAEIVGQCIVYRKPREPRAFFEWGEQAVMGKHLDRLLKSGEIGKEGDHYLLRKA